MRRRFLAGAVAAAAVAALGLTPAAAATSPQLSAVVSPTPVSWTPNVSADTTVGQEGSGAACNATMFGASQPCQSEVYGTAEVNGDVVVAGAFTYACQPGSVAQGLCTPGTQVQRNDIFAYKAGTGKIDPDFVPRLNAGPAWTVIPGPPGSNTVLVGGGFTTVNGVSRPHLVALHVTPGAKADGTIVQSFTGQTNGLVRHLALNSAGTALYVGGQFTSSDATTTFTDGQTVSGLVRLNASTGALDKSFGFGLGDAVGGGTPRVDSLSLTSSGAELAISGTMQTVDGRTRPRLAIINTGSSLGATSSLGDFTAPILSNECSKEHDYVRGVSFAPSGQYLVIADTGYSPYTSQGSVATCDTMTRFNVTAAATASTATDDEVSPLWSNYAGGDSFYSVVVSGNVVYAGGHERWIDNHATSCLDRLCAANAVLVGGLGAIDAHTGMALPWFHPLTLRGDGVMYLDTFASGTYDGSSSGLALGTDVDVIDGSYHAENALFPEAATTAANPGGPIPSGLFTTEGGASAATPLCLDEAGNATASGTPVDLATCANDNEQNWSRPTDKTVRVNGLCLGLAGGPAAGVLAAANTCTNSGTQHWTQGTGNTLINTGATATDDTSMCLTDPDSSLASGTQLSLEPCTGAADQVFPLPAAQGPPAGPPTGSVYPQEIQENDQVPCLDDTGDKTTAGNPLELETCRGDAEQQWTVTAGNTPGSSTGTIQLGSSSCLDSSGAAVVLEPCSGTSSQNWSWAADGELVQQSSGLCLDDTGANPANGAGLSVETCTGSAEQEWRLPAV